MDKISVNDKILTENLRKEKNVARGNGYLNFHLKIGLEVDLAVC